MGPALEFILKLKDLLTPGMRAAAQVNESQAVKIQSSLERVRSSSNKMAFSVDELRKRLEAVNKVRFSTHVRSEFDAATRSANALERQIEKLEGRQRSGGWIRRAAAVVGTAAMLSFGGTSLQAAAQSQSTQNAIDFSVGGAARGQNATRSIAELSDRLGLNKQAGIEGFKVFAGSTRNMAADSRMNIFKGVSEATAAFGLDGETQKGVFLALSQMASKGTVAAEELRGQLAERIPGALKIAADSLGVTERKLNDMLQKGQVVAADFLPKFGAELHRVFGDVAKRNADSAAANFNRLTNTLYDLRIEVGTQLMPTILPLLKVVIIPGIRLVGQLSGAVFGLINALREGDPVVVGITGVLAAFTAAVMWNNVATGAASIATKAWAGAQAVLNVIMNLNPIVLIISLIVALGVWIYVLVKKYEGWGKSMMGLWEIIKGFVKLNVVAWKDFGETIWYWIQYAWLKTKGFVEWIGGAMSNVWNALKLASQFKFGEARAALTAEIKTNASTQLEELERQHTAGRVQNQHAAVAALQQMQRGWNSIGLSKKGSAAPGIDPTIATAGQLGAGGGGQAGGADPLVDASKSKADSINQGGQRSIVINIDRQIEHLDVHVMSTEEAGTEVAAIVREEMRRVFHSLNGTTS